MHVDVRRLRTDEVEAVAGVLGLARLHQGDGFYLVAWKGTDPVGHAHLALTGPIEVDATLLTWEKSFGAVDGG